MIEEMLHDKMAQMIRVGIVNARQPEKMRVKVTIPDTTTSPLVTDWLPVLCPRASQDMQYDLPDVGDQVLCLFLAYGLEQGFVVGAMYGKQQPPVQNGDKWHRKFSDGAVLEYDRKSHSLLADIPGTAKIKCKDSITLEAPIIYLRGTLTNTAMDGGPGESVFSGGMTVQNGGVNVPDADVNASGVSLTDHSHEGVQAGNDTSSHPVGEGTGKGTEKKSGEQAMSAANIAANLAVIKSKVDKYAERNNENADIYKLIMCLPKIVNAMAENESNKLDKKGLLYLHDMIEIWLSSISNRDLSKSGKIFVVDWNWVISFNRAYFSYTEIRENKYLFSTNAKKLLIKRLKDNNCFTDKIVNFDFISQDCKKWRDYYFQYVSVRRQHGYLGKVDGLMAAMGAFVIYAFAKGIVTPFGNNKYKIYIKNVALAVYDTFNFSDKESYKYWNCNPPDFSVDYETGYLELTNDKFEAFRNEFGRGGDFIVVSEPTMLDIKYEFYYDFKL